MKKIPLTKGFVALVDDEDYERVVARGYWHAVYATKKKIYVRHSTHVNGQSLKTYLHRFILAAPSGVEVDHINGDGLDNQRHNLRLCSPSQNKINRKHNNPYGFKGIRKKGSRWSARIKQNQVELHLGMFSSQEEAARAYDAKAVELFGEFARLNFPKDVK